MPPINAEGQEIDNDGNVIPPVVDDDGIIVAIGAEPSLGSDAENDELIDGQPAPQWAKDLRTKAREDAKTIRTLEGQVAAATRAAPHKEPDAIVVGDKPTLESCDFDADKFETSLLAWTDRKTKAERQETDRTANATRAQTAYAERLTAYRVGVTALKVADFDASEKLIEQTLLPVQQSIIVKLAKNAALFVYALGRDPAKLKELSTITDPVEFAYQVAAIEKEIKTMPKSKFTMEKRPEGGGGGGRSAGTSAALAAARKKAETTGDYTEVNKLNREIRDAREKADAAAR